MGRAKFIVPVFLLASVARTAHADTVHLDSGRVIEGAAKLEGDKVIIELEAGRVTLPAHSVTRIDRAPSPQREVQKREAALAPGDTPGLLRLADFCRDHDLRRKERELLERIVALTPEHAEARRRLGFVRTNEGWVDGAELARREQRAQLEQRQTRLAVEKQALELKLVEAELARTRERAEAAERERERAERETAAPSPSAQVVYPVVYAPFGARPPRFPRQTRPSGPAPFPIPGVRDPQDMSFSLPGVRDPKSFIDDDRGRR